MKALVLAAGRGSRLGAASAGMPKPLTEVGGTTPLEHNLAWVAALRPSRIWINVHAHADVIRERVGPAAGGVEVAYSHEPELLGTAGAWKKLEAEWDDTSLVVYGDNLMRLDAVALLEAHAHSGAPVTIAVFDATAHVNTGIGGGRARVQGGRVVEFVEGGGTGMVNAGVYCVEPELAARIRPGYSDFGHDVLPMLAASGELAAHVMEPGAWCLGLDTPERLEIARGLLRTRVEAAS